jgi:hypothetical protein
MNIRWWWIPALAGLVLAGCNTPCQTYCDSITDFYNGCVVPPDDSGTEDLTWQSVGADSAEEYHSKCLDRFERALVVARTEDRNALYDWCITANLSVAAAPTCEDLELPEQPSFQDLEDEDPTGPSL